MDTLRGNNDAYDAYGADEDESILDEPRSEEQPRETPPPAIGGNERRMQVRAYNFWAAQLGNRNLPSIADLRPEEVRDFGTNGVLLDFSKSPDDPRIGYLGENLAKECDIGSKEITFLSDVPTRSLLSRITDHYMQIMANQAPIGFEAEFVNQRDATILYRGILLPYSSDDETIDYIFGVINWKELADQAAADELLLEIEQSVEPIVSRRRREEPSPLADWADGPGAISQDSVTDAEFAEFAEIQPYDDAYLADDMGEDELLLDNLAPGEPGVAEAQHMALADWLARAREQAQNALDREDRTRNALYEAIGRAWDFALASADAPEDLTELLQDAGLSVQLRAPMTPIVKLVFGADYDKTRLTEYAAALSHAKRLDLPRGGLADYLRSADGGLKGVVAIERKMRREEAGKPPRPLRSAPRKALVKRLNALAPQSLDAIAATGDEFALVMVRRDIGGDVVMLGEIPNDVGLLEKAARRLLD